MSENEEAGRRKPKEEDIPGPSVILISGKGNAWKLREERRRQRDDATEE